MNRFFAGVARRSALATVFLLTLLVTARLAVAGPIRIVASTTDLASIAAAVGGPEVEVTAICRANADPHHVEVLPSYMVKVARARLYLKVGLGLDQWADGIVEGSHSAAVQIVDCSEGVTVLEKPTGKVDASMGDVHPDGNPHYWLDPANGAVVAVNIARALARVDAAHAADYQTRADQFGRDAQALLERGRASAAALPNRDILTYHRSWSYFAAAFGLEVIATVEPIPGIPPTGKHLDSLLALIKERHPVALLEEPYFSEDAGKFLNRETGLHVERIAAACDETTAGSYFAHFDAVLGALTGGAGSSAAPAGR